MTHKIERIHSLDSLRAIMMLLGLVLHSALTYNVINHGEAWSLKDPESNTIITDSIVFIIHFFRMPIFFLVAGFFGSMLFYERNPIKMIKNRISRIAYPFIVFLLILSPIIIYIFSYTQSVFSKSNKALLSFSDFSDFLPTTTFHLWFLYYLILITLVSVILGLLLKKLKKFTGKITSSFNWLIQKPLLRVLFFSGITFLLYLFMETSMVEVSVFFKPDLNTFIFHFFFYLIGWILFKSKQHLDTMMHYDRLCIALALLIATIEGLIAQNLDPETMMTQYLNSKLIMFLNSIIVWLFVFGISGLFIRYASKHSKRIRYISDASYWVYLIHLPIAALIPAFISNWALPAIIKFLIVFFITTSLCFVSYHYLVRASFIGKFLNGRKYTSKKPKP
jgi:peptidoglycan/LPS O-acetylase OafA/YrhL